MGAGPDSNVIAINRAGIIEIKGPKFGVKLKIPVIKTKTSNMGMPITAKALAVILNTINIANSFPLTSLLCYYRVFERNKKHDTNDQHE